MRYLFDALIVEFVRWIFASIDFGVWFDYRFTEVQHKTMLDTVQSIEVVKL